MRHARLILALLLANLICYAGEIASFMYPLAVKEPFQNLGVLPSFATACKPYETQAGKGCDVLYRVPIGTILKEHPLKPEIIELGVGVIAGGAEWFCSAGSKWQKVFENNPSGGGFFREGLMLYSSTTLPTYLCKDDLFIKVTSDPRHSMSQVGWKSGSLVLGSTAVVRSYKNVIDFFSSYFRILVSMVCLLLLLVSRSNQNREIRGYPEFRAAILFVAVHFLASSSILDVLIPNSFGFGFLLIMAAGSAGPISLALSATKAENIFRKSPLRPGRVHRLDTSKLWIVFAFFAIFYFWLGARSYAPIQLVIAAALVALSFLAVAPSYVIFSLLMVSNLLPVFGILKGFPTNTAAHFLLILFIIDSFENIHLNNMLMSFLSSDREKVPVADLTAMVVNRFSLKRISTSMFTRDYEFVTKLLFSGQEIVLAVERKVSRLAAHVMTARTPLLRVRVGSEESRILKGPGATENRARGKEFCIFPLHHSERMLGTLNISGYPSWVMGDPSQMFLFYSLLQKVVPRIALTRYREDLSPNIEDQHSIREIESSFLSLAEKSKDDFLTAMNAIAKRIDAKLIISKALPDKDKFETFCSHHYGETETKFLEKHTPKLSSTLLTSPSNIAYHHKTNVFINNLETMFSIYPDYLINLFRKNETKSLLVSPIFLNEFGAPPWGLIWLEFNNRITRPEADLRELAEFAANSIARVLKSFFEHHTQQNIVNEISATIPKHVMEKIRQDINPREEEQGYLLNVDLAGSTNLSRKLGSKKFAETIGAINEMLTEKMTVFHFVGQIVVWDSFVFTRPASQGDIKAAEARKILETIEQCIRSINQKLDDECQISFRAVLNFGDTTRDWSKGSAKYWTIAGSAYAESCKLETEIKKKRRVLLVAATCPGHERGGAILELESEKRAA
jgi:hypothetical protein